MITLELIREMILKVFTTHGTDYTEEDEALADAPLTEKELEHFDDPVEWS